MSYLVEPITAGKIKKGDTILFVGNYYGAWVAKLLEAPKKANPHKSSAYVASTQWDGVDKPVKMVIGYPKQTVLRVLDE